MFLEVCLISMALHSGSKMYEKLKGKLSSKKNAPPSSKAKKAVQRVNAKSSPDSKTITTYEKEVNRHLMVSAISAGLAGTGALIYAPLSMISVIGIMYTAFPVFKIGIKAVFKERRVRAEILDSIAIIATLLCGYIFIIALALTVYHSAHKLRIKTENKAKESLINIFGEQPGFVWILKDEVEIEIPFESLKTDDIVVVRAGEQVPADGLITKGMASIDQHVLTGEAQPAEKGIGERVFAATVVLSGRVQIQVTKTGKETVAAKIGEILKNTTDFTAFIESAGQKIADASVIPTLALSIGALPFVGVLGTVSLLCSCYLVNMRLVAPLSMLNFLQIASDDGILIKDGRSLQLLPQVDTVVFDKTGTLTMLQPCVRNIYLFENAEEETVLAYAAAAEYRQKHPIAAAILEEARKRKLTISTIDDAEYKIGYGISVTIDKKLIRVGSQRFVEMENIEPPAAFAAIQTACHERGCSIVCVAENDRLIGAIELEPAIRSEVKQIIRRLRKRNISFYIISGDHEKPTRMMAEKLGIEHYYSEVLPENKAELIEHLQACGKKVCFVGDGINDSIALKKANVSVSIRGASTVATDAAQIVLMDKTLKKLPDLFDISYEFQNNMKDTFFVMGSWVVFFIGGVFFVHLRIISSQIGFGASLLSGATVSTLPALKKRKIQT